VLSWFYDRYTIQSRRKIRGAWFDRGLTHVLLSWPDSQDFGQSPEQFKAICAELIADGFFPCVMLSAKPTSSAAIRSDQETLDNIMLVLPLLVGLVPMVCVGWELSLWHSPSSLQFLIDNLAPVWLKQPGTLGYIHLQEGYMSFPEAGHDNASFWLKQVGKLTGVLLQKRLSQNDGQFVDWLHDVLLRMAGGFNMPADSGFGHPFDAVMCEISAQTAFNGQTSEAEQNRLGQLAIHAPAVNDVGVMGSGNGL
jgi:hypothetical protein